MNQHVATILRRIWIGLAGVVLSLAAALAITAVWGPLWGEFGWRFVAGALMVAGFFGLILAEEFLRAPNPYTRVHPLFGYMDLGPAGDLKSSDPSLFWAAGPMLVCAVALFLSSLLM